MGDPNLREMIYWIFNKLKSGNFGNSGGGSGGITQTQLDTALNNKVDKVAGKGLSTNDYTNDDKNKITLIGNKLDKGGYTGTAQDLKNAIDTVNSKTIHWNDIQNKPNLNYLPITGGTVNGDITANSIIKKNSSNDKVLLGGGGEINLSELKNENIKVGCRNLALNTKNIGELNISETHTILNSIMEKLQENELCMLSFDAKTVLPNTKSLLHIESYGDNSTVPGQRFVEVKGDKYKRYSVYVKLLDISNKNLFVWLTEKESNVVVKDFKLYRGTQIEDWSPAPEDFIEQRTIYVDSDTFNITTNIIGKTVHINRNCTINYNDMPLLSTVCFRKVYDGGQITFHGGGILKYTGDTVFNGNNGSTAVLDMSADINRIYIDIRNI